MIDTKYQNGCYIALILALTYFYCFYVATYSGIPQKLKDMHQSCLLGECKNDTCQKIIDQRGDNYIIEKTDEVRKRRIKNCSFTFWNLSHFMLYAVITFLCPQMYMEFFIMGLGFEVYECYMYDCHDAMDIVANTAGILAGKSAASLVAPKVS